MKTKIEFVFTDIDDNMHTKEEISVFIEVDADSASSAYLIGVKLRKLLDADYFITHWGCNTLEIQESK